MVPTLSRHVFSARDCAEPDRETYSVWRMREVPLFGTLLCLAPAVSAFSAVDRTRRGACPHPACPGGQEVHRYNASAYTTTVPTRHVRVVKRFIPSEPAHCG